MPDFGRWTSNGGDPSLNEINRADRFFEALAAKQPVYSTDPAEAELAFLFSEFRDDVRDTPITAPVSPGDAVHALQSGLARNRGSRRSFAVIGSVAAAMLCIGGFGTAVYGAGPGDSLYGMRTTIFGQQEATRDDQVSLASAQLQQVQQLIDNGQWEEAQDKLVAVSNTVQSVDAPVESKQQLVEQWNALTYKVVEQDPAATLPPGEPLPVLPSSPLTWLPVPVVEATTSQTSTTSESTTTSETSQTTLTSPSDSSVPPEVLLTPPSDGSTTPSASAGSTSPTSPSSSSTAPSTTPSPTSAPPSSTTTTVPPSSTTTTTTTLASATTTTTTTTVPPVAEAPASQPRVPANSSVAAPAPSSVPAPVPASSAPAVAPSQPVTSAAPVERPSAEPTTTTLLPPS
ncbi:MAG: hypothetical protein JWR11_1849 [Mycobacterium sp.]|jgi:hypothetical protein|nr:hypothetical protein [Mycobacterium sp.]MDT5180663.1 hypothetical protein [Mycobacterium sp.]